MTKTADMCLGLTTFGGLEVWASLLIDGKIGVVLFNRSPQADQITAHWSDIGADAAQKFAVRDVWAAADRGSSGSTSPTRSSSCSAASSSGV